MPIGAYSLPLLLGPAKITFKTGKGGDGKVG